MFQISIRIGLSALLLLSIFSVKVFAAEAVTMGVDHEKVRVKNGETNKDPNRVVKTDVTMVSYDDAEASLLPQTVQQAIDATLKDHPGAVINVVCATGGRMSGAGCDRQKEEIGKKDKKKDAYTFDKIDSTETVLPGVTNTGVVPTERTQSGASAQQVPNGVNNLPPPGSPPGTTGEVPAPAPKKPSDWKLRLSILRAVTAGGAVALTIAIGHPEHWERMAGAMIGAATLLGAAKEVAKDVAPVIATTAWSGGMQAIQRPYGNWLRQASWFSSRSPEESRREAFSDVDKAAKDVTSRFLTLLRENTVEKPTFDKKDLEHFVKQDGAFNPFDAAPGAKTRYAIATDPGTRRQFKDLIDEGGIDWKRVKEQMGEAITMHGDAAEMKARPVEGKYMSWHSSASFLQSLGKKAMSSTLYALLMSSAFYASGLNAHAPFDSVQLNRTGQAVVESLYTQTAWESLISEGQERRLKAAGEDVHLQARAKRIAGVQRLVLSFINVATGAMNVLGLQTELLGTEMKAGFIVAGVVGTAGLLTYGYRWLPDSLKKPVDATMNGIGHYVLKPIGHAFQTLSCGAMALLGRRPQAR